MRLTIFDALRSPRPVPAPAPRLVYRLRHWPERLPSSLRTARVLKALSLMSHRPVHREWMLRHLRLEAGTLDRLLAVLAANDDLQVIDTSTFSRA